MYQTMAWRYCNTPADFAERFGYIEPRSAPMITKYMHEELRGKFRSNYLQGWGDYLELAYLRETTRGEG